MLPLVPASPRLFVSYRRDDGAMAAGRLADTLHDRGLGNVFLDVESIAPGQNYKRRIEEEIAASDAVLVIVGPRWMAGTRDDPSPRITRPRDWVRLEIEAALERGVPLVPVLVDRATMPEPEELPATVSDFAYVHAAELSATTWTRDVDELVKALRRLREPGLPTPAPVDDPAPDGGAEQPRVPRNRAVVSDPAADDVVVVAARSAYAEYLEGAAYVCGAGRTFRPTAMRMGFYFDRLVRPEFPTILHERDDVRWDRGAPERLRERGEAFDAEVADVIERQWLPGSVWFAKRNEARRYKVVLLTAASDPSTFLLRRPIRHEGASAFVMRQRYVDLADLQTDPETTEALVRGHPIADLLPELIPRRFR